MDKRLSGTWNDSEEDEELQRRFQTLFELTTTGKERCQTRMGADFLPNNLDLPD